MPRVVGEAPPPSVQGGLPLALQLLSVQAWNFHCCLGLECLDTSTCWQTSLCRCNSGVCPSTLALTAGSCLLAVVGCCRWLILCVMCGVVCYVVFYRQAQENQILEHLLDDHVIRTVSNIKSEELGVRQYR